MKPKLAHRIDVYRNGGEFRVEVDGETFPWFTQLGTDVTIRKDDMPAITVTIPAESVHVVDELGESQ